MYVIACIKGDITYWSDSKVHMSLETAIGRLTYLQAKGHGNIAIYEIMDLKKLDI